MKDFEDLKNLYLGMKKRRGEEAYKYMHELLDEAKELRYAYLAEHDPDKDKGQSWRSFKGKNFQKLIQYIITESIETLGLKAVNDNELNKKKLSDQLDAVKRNVVINYGKNGMHLPDADIVVYNPKNFRVIAIISCKTSLRERVAQTGYWKFKFCQNSNTKHIKVYLITPDSDGTLTKIEPHEKGRAIAESDLDGTYVLTTEDLEETDQVKLFGQFVKDFKKVVRNR